MVTLRSELKGWEQREYQIKQGLIECNLSVKKNRFVKGAWVVKKRVFFCRYRGTDYKLRTTKETIQANNKALKRALLFGSFNSFVMTIPIRARYLQKDATKFQRTTSISHCRRWKIVIIVKTKLSWWRTCTQDVYSNDCLEAYSSPFLLIRYQFL